MASGPYAMTCTVEGSAPTGICNLPGPVPGSIFGINLRRWLRFVRLAAMFNLLHSRGATRQSLRHRRIEVNIQLRERDGDAGLLECVPD